MSVAAGQVSNERVVRLIEAYREHGRILNHIVRRYLGNSGESYEDLLQVGYIGLIKAVNGYQEGSRAKFSSYAYSMIDGEIRHHFRDTALLRKPRWARSLYSKVAEATAKLTSELGRPPRIEEIAKEVNVTTEGVLELMKLFLDTNVSSLDEGDDEGDETNVAAIKNIQYETFALPIEERIQLEQSLQKLTELQREVVYLFFYKDLSQTEIGQRLGLPQRKVSRVVASAVKSLRDAMNSRD